MNEILRKLEILLTLSLYICNPVEADNNINILANVCYPGTYTNEFAFAKPVVCVANPPGNIIKCDASVSQPRAEEIEVKAYACFKTIEGWQSYVSFFGGREKTELEPTQHSLTYEECRAMIDGNYNPNFGKMIPDETGKIMKTQNKRKIEYKWNQNLAGATQNRVLMKITLIYNFHDDEIISSLSMMPGCAIRKGFCNVDKYTYLWDAEKVPLCFPTLFYNHTVSIHTDKKGKVMNIRIPKLGLAYNHLTECPPYVIDYREKNQRDIENFHCPAEGMVFYTANCQELKKGKPNNENTRKNMRSDGNKADAGSRGSIENLLALDTYNFLADEIEDL